MRATGLRSAAHVRCDSAHPSPAVCPQYSAAQQHPLCEGWGDPGPTDAGFDPDVLSPHSLSPCHQLLPANCSGSSFPARLAAGATRLPCGREQHSLPSKDPRAYAPRAAACTDSVVTFTWVNPGGQGFQLNQLWKGPFTALPFLHFFVH